MAGLATRESAERGARGGADPVTTQIVRHGLDAGADQMRVALCRTAFSPIIYEMTDFAAALYGAPGPWGPLPGWNGAAVVRRASVEPDSAFARRVNGTSSKCA